MNPGSSPADPPRAMRNRNIRQSIKTCAALCVVLLAGLVGDAVAQVDATQTGGVKRALLVGINRYKSVPGLQGSVNDVETMREILTTRWGFEARNITVLTDENATRDKMLAALNQLVQESGPDDTVYFHYSGHGSQVQDLNGDEEDGLDETIVPQDGRSGNVPDIVDDELDAIFSRLRARSAVIVLDSCHSGTATRAIDIRTRSVPQDTRVDLYRAGVTGITTRGIVPLKRSRFVVMGGAAANEEALDGPVEGSFHGFFTYALSRAFTTAGSSASPREIFAGVTRELGRIQTTFGRTSMPEPQLEAPPGALDLPLFATRAAAPTSAASTDQGPRLAWLSVQPTAAGQVTLANGVLLGATPGSSWAVYPRGERQFAAGRALAVATVTQLAGKDARASLTNQTGPIESESRAVALMPAPSPGRVAIRILDMPAADRSRIESALRRNIRNLLLVGADQPARFLVDLQGQTVRLLSADGLRVMGSFAVNDDSSAADMARVAARSAKAAELLALDNPSSQLAVTVRVAGAQPLGTRDIRLVTATGPAQLHSRHQEEARSVQNSLQLNIAVSADAYITIVDVDPEGSMNVLFPNDYQHPDFHPNGAVRAGEQVSIPDSLQTGNRAGFHWDYSPPRGTDTVRVFASTDLATAETIRRRIRSLQQSANQGRGNVQTRGIPEDLGTLRADLTGLATRGITTVADPVAHGSVATPADWAATSVTIEVGD
jgi:hypothetical protein